MMCIVTAYFDCTDILKPYLFKFLEQTAYDSQRPHQGWISILCAYLFTFPRINSKLKTNASQNSVSDVSVMLWFFSTCSHSSSVSSEPQDDLQIWWPKKCTKQSGGGGPNGTNLCHSKY